MRYDAATAVLFGTLRLAERLEAAGMAQARARGVAAASGEVATKADIAEMRTEIAGVRTEIAELRGKVDRTRRDVGHLREYLDLRFGEARHGSVNALPTGRRDCCG